MKKKIIKYTIVFLLFLFWNLVVQPYCYDEVWNYGFSYSITKGLLPYKDFNVVVTPFSIFLYAIPMLVFGHNILILHIFNTFIIVGIFIILDKLFEDNSYILMTLLFFTARTITPGYNLLLLFIYVLILYCEKENKSDLFIGLLLGLSVLTKQSVGLLLILPSFIYIKDLTKIKKRIIGIFILCIIFLLYLLITNSLYKFLDLCLFGLFDFAANNREKFKLFLYVYIIVFLLIIRLIMKDRKNIFNYYTLAYSSIAIPLFDLLHVHYVIFAFFILLFLNRQINIKLNGKLFFLAIYVLCSIIFIKSNGIFKYPNKIHNFEYRTLNNDFINFTNKINSYIEKNDKYNYIFLTSEAYFFKIINEKDINYLDLINYGNQGYHGTDKLINLIDKNKSNTIFFINREELVNGCQVDKEAVNYVINNSKKIDEIYVYDLYIFDYSK